MTLIPFPDSFFSHSTLVDEFRFLHVLIQLSWILFTILGVGDDELLHILVFNNAFDLVCLPSNSEFPFDSSALIFSCEIIFCSSFNMSYLNKNLV